MARALFEQVCSRVLRFLLDLRDRRLTRANGQAGYPPLAYYRRGDAIYEATSPGRATASRDKAAAGAAKLALALSIVLQLGSESSSTLAASPSNLLKTLARRAEGLLSCSKTAIMRQHRARSFFRATARRACRHRGGPAAELALESRAEFDAAEAEERTFALEAVLGGPRGLGLGLGLSSGADSGLGDNDGVSVEKRFAAWTALNFRPRFLLHAPKPLAQKEQAQSRDRRPKRNSSRATLPTDTPLVSFSAIAVTPGEPPLARRMLGSFELISDSYEGEIQDEDGSAAAAPHDAGLENRRCTVCGTGACFSQEQLQAAGNTSASFSGTGEALVAHELLCCATCGTSVHARCYGLIARRRIDEPAWRCELCVADSVPSTAVCEVCLRPPAGLASKLTERPSASGGFAHVICAATNVFVAYAYGKRAQLDRPCCDLLRAANECIIAALAKDGTSFAAVAQPTSKACAVCCATNIGPCSVLPCNRQERIVGVTSPRCATSMHASCALQAGLLRVTHFTFGAQPDIPGANTLLRADGEWSGPRPPLPPLLLPGAQGPLSAATGSSLAPFFVDFDLTGGARLSTDTLCEVEESASPYLAQGGEFVTAAVNAQLARGLPRGAAATFEALLTMVATQALSSNRLTPARAIVEHAHWTSLLEIDARHRCAGGAIAAERFDCTLEGGAFVAAAAAAEAATCSLDRAALAHRRKESSTVLPGLFTFRVACPRHLRHARPRPDAGRRFVGAGAGCISGRVVPLWARGLPATERVIEFLRLPQVVQHDFDADADAQLRLPATERSTGLAVAAAAAWAAGGNERVRAAIAACSRSSAAHQRWAASATLDGLRGADARDAAAEAGETRARWLASFAPPQPHFQDPQDEGVAGLRQRLEVETLDLVCKVEELLKLQSAPAESDGRDDEGSDSEDFWRETSDLPDMDRLSRDAAPAPLPAASGANEAARAKNAAPPPVEARPASKSAREEPKMTASTFLKTPRMVVPMPTPSPAPKAAPEPRSAPAPGALGPSAGTGAGSALAMSLSRRRVQGGSDFWALP
jgi:hypothetical protein